MDAEDQARVLDRIQEKFDIDEITEDNILEFMRYKPKGTLREYTWQEHVWRGNVKTAEMRTRTETYKTKGSGRQIPIAQMMGKISDIYDKADTQDLNKTDKDYREYIKKFKLTEKNKDEVLDKVKDKLIDLQDNLDIKSLARIKVKETEFKQQYENRFFNTAMTRFRELRDANDKQGLQNLKSELSGTVVDREITPEIDRILERLE
jgi:hypothetical protein